jgi:uncharacterized lipoprotein YbaY/heat shock protein HslJ
MVNPYLLALLTLAIPLGAEAASSSISGSATYRERMALPPEAVFEAALEDVSRADAPATELGRTQVKSPGQVPIHFTISYDPGRIEPQHRYGVRARIYVGNELWFTTDAYIPVSLDAQAPVEILLKRSSGTAAPTAPALSGLPVTFIGTLPCADCEGLRYQLDLKEDGRYFLRRTYLGKSSAGTDETGRWRLDADGRTLSLQSGGKTSEQFAMTSSDTLRLLDRAGRPIDSKLNYELKRQPTSVPNETAAAIEEQYWKLVSVGGGPVKVTEPQREPHIILHSDTKRVSGSGGCNRLTGSYTLKGEQITFGQMAGTMMACPDGMEQEQAFLAALTHATRWRVTHGEMQLFDASGTLLAQFKREHT